MHRIHRLAAASIALIGAAAQTQYDPAASAQLGAGMGRTALSQSTLSGTRQLGAMGQGAARQPSPRFRAYCQQHPHEKACIKNGLGDAALSFRRPQ